MIRKLLTIALAATPLTLASPASVEAQDGDIVAVARSAGSFETLLMAVAEADLVSTLRSPGPFTLFAPTDEAFAKIPKDDLKALLQNKEALRRVLLYHVVPGEVASSEVVSLETAGTAAGQSLTISVENGSVKVDDATVVATDIEASNGIIHVIDRVILPEMASEASSR